MLFAGLPDDYYKPIIKNIENSGMSIIVDFIKTKIIQEVNSQESGSVRTFQAKQKNKKNIDWIID